MEHNDKAKIDAEKEQTNEAPKETTTSEDLENVNKNDSDNNEEGIYENNADKDEEEDAKEEEEDDGLDEINQDGFASVEMLGQRYEKDENNRPPCRYNTVCYRKIKRGNTKQRIDEFESILDV
ncbi:ermin-like [Danio aesculapii]|uniref:ermin-like n=1 Tax=Danio aesculapii TaxID=1142201 RepID=UPI0024BF9AD5|nr:ermin-like [Danio aesculapii]